MLSEAADADGPEDHRPEVDEHHLDVERDEEQRVDVERQAEPAVGVAVGVDARLVGQALVLVALVAVRDEPRGADRQEHERDAGEGEAHDVPDAGQPDIPSSDVPGEASLAGRKPLGERAGRPARDASAPEAILAVGAGPARPVGVPRPGFGDGARSGEIAGGRGPGAGATGLVGGVGERRAPSARAGSRAAPRQVVPDRREACAPPASSGNR